MGFFSVKSTVLGSREMCNFGVFDPCCNGSKNARSDEETAKFAKHHRKI
jgi:hypothetical protein